MFNKKWGSLDLQLFLVAAAISGFQGDVDTDVEKPSWLGLRLIVDTVILPAWMTWYKQF